MEFEQSLHASGARYVIGCDEVGRGAIAGPVAVGLTVVDASVGTIPVGVRDSKLLSESRREVLAPLCASWVLHSAVGLASAREIDRLGITACLGLAAKRALTMLHTGGVDVAACTVLLDGKHDWLTPALSTPLPLVTRVKADRDCGSVAAASVIAKVHRDHLMIGHDAEYPGYGWPGNKGYGSAVHFAAIAELGASQLHRRTWLHALAGAGRIVASERALGSPA